jgi:prepilin-type N-terminal cleavage/methylation domain-containing protein
MNKKIKGFTLIELLVVIAIIGILASTVLVSLNSARGKAQDVKVISGVKQIKTIIESNYTGVTYPDLTNDATKIFGGLVADANPGTTTLNVLLGDIASLGSTINIVNSPATEGEAVLDYAIYGQLVSTTTQWFCIDSKGTTNQATSDPTQAICPQ